MKKKILTVLALGLMSAVVFAEGDLGFVVSSNIHAMVKLQSALTNTIIAVPWTFYTPDGQPTTNLPVDRLVRPTNLTVGDMVMVLVTNAVYATWQLIETDEVMEGGYKCRRWREVDTIRRIDDKDERSDVYKSAHQDQNIQRGLGLWLYRQNPLNADGSAKDIYLYGQYTTNDAEVVIAGGSVETPTFTLLADPFPAESVNLNEVDNGGKALINGIQWDWDNIGDKDTVIIVNDRNTHQYCYRRALAAGGFERKWCWDKTVTTIKKVGAKTREVASTEHIYDLPFDPHVGFWYVRRTGSTYTFTWKKPTEAAAAE